MSIKGSDQNAIIEIEKEYKKFLFKLNSLKKEQDKCIKEYGEKLEQRKLAYLRKQLGIQK